MTVFNLLLLSLVIVTVFDGLMYYKGFFFLFFSFPFFFFCLISTLLQEFQLSALTMLGFHQQCNLSSPTGLCPNTSNTMP